MDASEETGTKTVKILAGATEAKYTVATVDDSTDEPDGGTVTVRVSANSNYSVGPASTATVTVNDDDAPAVSSVELVVPESDTRQNSTYTKNSTVRARVTFGVAVDVASPNPVLKLLFATGTEKDMALDTNKATTGTTTLEFTYKVAEGDLSTGLGFAANKLSTAGTIRASGTTTAVSLVHDAVAASTSHKVDAVAPTVSSVELVVPDPDLRQNDTYKKDDEVRARVTFTEAVDVTAPIRC